MAVVDKAEDKEMDQIDQVTCNCDDSAGVGYDHLIKMNLVLTLNAKIRAHWYKPSHLLESLSMINKSVEEARLTDCVC